MTALFESALFQRESEVIRGKTVHSPAKMRLIRSKSGKNLRWHSKDVSVSASKFPAFPEKQLDSSDRVRPHGMDCL